MALLLVVNLHGKINSNRATRQALEELKVERKFTASLVPDDVPSLGMLRTCKDYVAWAPVDKALLSKLLEKRGMASERKKLDTHALTKLGFKKYEDLAAQILKDEKRLSAVKGLRPFFRLSPPRGGFKLSLRRQASERGTLGKNPTLPQIVERMV